jgi:hypothetical protein
MFVRRLSASGKGVHRVSATKAEDNPRDFPRTITEIDITYPDQL